MVFLTHNDTGNLKKFFEGTPDPRDNDEHASREVVGDDVVGHLPLEDQLEPRDRVVARENLVRIRRMLEVRNEWMVLMITLEILSSSLSSDMSTQ